ncbi:MAG: hypothetical protein LBC44_02340, partial [Mycoplasmataceae bacterium]|nr:hypothetical protein [Mycoplasmataceae bacterium]
LNIFLIFGDLNEFKIFTLEYDVRSFSKVILNFEFVLFDLLFPEISRNDYESLTWPKFLVSFEMEFWGDLSWFHLGVETSGIFYFWLD